MKHIYTKQRLLRLSLLFVLLTACASFLNAQDVWRGTTSNKWSVASNWSLGRVPTSSDDVVIGSATITNQPTIDVSAVCKSLTIASTYAGTLTQNFPLTVSGNLTANQNGTFNINNTLVVSGSIIVNANSNINANSSITVAGSVTINANSNFIHAASQTLAVSGNWTCSGNYVGQSTSLVVFAGGAQTINGSNVDFKKLTINAGSSVLLNANVNADVSVVCNGTWDPNEGTSTYLLSGSTSFTVGSTGVAKVKAVDAGSNYMPYGGATLAVGSTVDYASTLVTQNIYSNFSYDNIKISGSGIKKLTGDYAGWNTSGVDVGNVTVMSGCTLDLYSFSLSRGNTGGTLTVNDGATLRIGGTNSLPTFMNYSFGTNSTVEYYGSPQTITPASYGNLWITGTGTKTAGGALTVNDLSLNTATFVGGSYTHSIKSDWSMTSGTFTNTGTVIQFNGTGAQTISSTGAFNDLLINKASGTTSLSSSITVNGTLTFTSGNITTGTNKVIIPSTGSVVRTSGHVVGNLQKYVATGSNVSRTFEVGDASTYAPVTTLFASVSAAGSLVVNTTSGSHASGASSTIDQLLDVNRYWTLTNSGITFTSYSPTFGFVAGDVSSGALTGSFIVGRYNAGWTYPTVGTKTATGTQATGLTAFGDFVVGEAKQSLSISYAGSPFCSSASSVAVTLTGTSGGTYTATPAGLAINASTGAITPSSSTAGTYTVTYTRGSSSATASVTITTAPSATISYGSSSYCKSVSTAQLVTLTGTSGGSYTASPAGLSINASTGAVTPSTSTAGAYTVTYTIAASGGCAAFTTTTSVAIITAPSATISYAGPFCNSVSSAQAVTLTGTSGGTFSSTIGLSINATTGAITPSASTPGTYTVTYTIAASGGCSSFTTTTSVTILAVPTATISYAGPFCSSTSTLQSVTRTGTTGGTYSALPAGLFINAVTGDITPSASTPGTYTVTYAFTSGGCSATATASVTITAAPSATITYAGPFCSSLSTPQAATITGTTGGTFSSTVGLTINATTGAITPSTSTPGTYTVTYTIAASGGCAAYSTTTSVKITAAPSATISYTSSSFCKSLAGAISVTRTGTTGGTYSASPAGLTINASTGDITPSTSTAGTYTVTYTVAAANGCGVYTTTTSVTITAVASATIAYAGPFCASVSTPQAATISGTTGGTFSSTTGLSINATTGAITPSASTVGTYTVTYTIAASGGCSTYTTTAIVVVTAAPSATISYAGPFCNSVSSPQPVTLTGTTGGAFSSTAGLTINATTGAITPSTSTPGTYTVTYTIAASGGCAAYTTTATVTIVATPTASIGYAGPFCSSTGTLQHVTRTGTSGGTYSASPAGLTLDTGNGDITPSTSTPGTYTVTYTFTSGGCSASATATVTINAASSATITYAGPFCSSVSTPQAVSFTGTAGGTYSSTAGLTINATTGDITPSASTPGTYTVTYSVAASGACAAYNATASVTITAAPSASINYASSSFCKSVGAAQHVTRTGTTGGTYSASPAGLTLNTGNGDITPSSSTAGTYTVTYTVAASGGCAAYTTTTSVTITTAPSATISYAGPFCNSVSSAQAVTLTGTTGGTFSSTTGLSINASTGAITPSSSTPGTYTVTYIVAASGGCSAYSTTASVTITATPSATIAYPGSPYSTAGGTISVVRTGTSGGAYSSTTGLSINAGNGDINLGASTVGTYTVTYTIAASGGCAAYTTTTTIAINLPYSQWTGAKSTDWKNAGNWNPAKVPDQNADVIIPAGLSVYPVIPGGVNDPAAEDLTVASGASLTLYGTLTVGGNISSNGGIVADSIGTIVMKSNTAQTISAGAFANELFDLVIDNNAGVTLLGKLKLNDALIVKNGALTSNGNLVLRSTVVRTARVGQITSKAATPIIGDVTVERYVAGRRKYRLITSAVTTSKSTVLTTGQESRSIWGNWQNSGNNSTPGVGTFITGGTAAAGFDTQTGSASLYTYNDITRKFVAFSSTNGKNTKYTPLVAGVGYYMFVYGDRTNSVSTPTPNNTTLSETGTLVTGDQLYTTTTPIHLADTIGKYTLIGNPFASPINWQSVQKSGVDNICWGWDPNLGSTGGYVTVNATLSGTILISPLSTKVKLDQYIQSGQAFFVRTIGKNPTITIQENDKVTNVNNLAFRTAGTQKTATALPLLAVNLLYTSAGSEVFADGAVAAFDNSFADTLGTEDALKIAGSAEAVAIENSGQQLSIDARPKALGTDTLNLNLAKLTKAQYTLQVFAQHMIGGSVQGYLVDRYLGTSKILSLTDTNNVVFNIVPSDSASFDPHRFYVSLVNLATLPVNYTAVLAMQEGKNVQVQWNVAAENNINTYQVEKSTNGVNFTVTGEVAANKLGGDDHYSWLDLSPALGYNYYRIRAVGNSGASYLSKVVNLKISTGVADITVSPNPVKDQQINLQLRNIDTGTYNAVLYDPQGREVYRTKLNYTGGFLFQALQPKVQLTPGMYYLRIFNERTKYDVRILME